MMPNTREIHRVLERAGLPRARFIGTMSEPRWTFGFGISDAQGQLTVWCNPGGPTREAWHRSSMLADRVDQCLTIAGYSTYRDRDRDPQQVIIMGESRPLPTLDPHQHLKNKSKAASFAALVFVFLFPFVKGPGAILAALVCLTVAMYLGIEYENRQMRNPPETVREGKS